MNAVVVYRAVNDDLAWLVVRPSLAERAKQGLRQNGTPAIAVIRPMPAKNEEPYE